MSLQAHHDVRAEKGPINDAGVCILAIIMPGQCVLSVIHDSCRWRGLKIIKCIPVVSCFVEEVQEN